MNNIPIGYCQCGCGSQVPVALSNDKHKGWIKGKPRCRYINGHYKANREKNGNWKGGKVFSLNGYVFILVPGHPRADHKGYVFEHILIAESILGKYLPPKAVIHHINNIPSDNRPENLIICQNQTYHIFLHQRIKALKICGHATWRKCKICKKYDSIDNLKLYKNGHIVHLRCSSVQRKQRYAIEKQNKALLWL